MRRKGDTTPNKGKPNRSIQTPLFSQGSSVSSLQESPFVEPPPRDHAIFGSGSHHSTHAIYKRFSKEHFHGKFVGLISAADTRMAGYFIAFARLLRVKNVLKSTIALSEFLNLTNKKSSNRTKKIKWAI